MSRRYAWFSTALSILETGVAFVAVLAIAAGVYFGISGRNAPARQEGREVTVLAPPMENGAGTLEQRASWATAEATFTDAPVVTAAQTPVPTNAPTAVPTEPPLTMPDLPASLYRQTANAVGNADPKVNGLTQSKVYVETSAVSSYARTDEIHMGSSAEYTALEGITTFRGSNYRDSGAYGSIPNQPKALSILWEKRIGGLDKWSGVGWTGQASAVRWSDTQRESMNINAEKRDKSGLVEVIYATLDGNIYFLDLDDGQETRSAIRVGAPIKGSLSIDPRGYPLLYCGQGIYEVKGKRVKCGTRVWSLLDQSLLYLLDGNDSVALRAWQAFDCAPLIDGDTDTMITAGENGVLYAVKLNTRYLGDDITISPQIVRYTYEQSLKGKIGTENSVAIYNQYVYFVTNIGIVQCVDLNTMQTVWTYQDGDDTDASLVIEVETDGTVALYGANELDQRGHRGTSQLFKLNALTGEELWRVDSDPIYQHDENGGGSFATPAVGKGELSELVYFHVALTRDTHGMLYALNKRTGQVVWQKSMGAYGWSSPTCVYAENGRGYVLVGSCNGLLRLFDGLSGEEIARADLGANIEGSPIVFGDTIVVGTRGSRIYGIRIIGGDRV